MLNKRSAFGISVVNLNDYAKLCNLGTIYLTGAHSEHKIIGSNVCMWFWPRQELKE